MMALDNVRIQIDEKDYHANLEEFEIICGPKSNVCGYVFKAFIIGEFEPFHGVKQGKVFGQSLEFYCGSYDTVIEAGNHKKPLLAK